MQRLAPQLVAFAGTQSNFQNLVSGLAAGTPVQLASVLPDGSAQIVSFTPAVALTPEEIALSLTGGIVPTALERATPVAPASAPTLRH